MVYFWIGCILIFTGIEIVTVALVSIWFIVGSLAALAVALLGGQIWLQAVAFLVVSGLCMLVARRYIRIGVKKQPTNADRVLGMTALVTEDIDNVLGTGTASVEGKSWTARSLTGERLLKGSYVRPVSIQGVKLIVEKIKEE